MTALLLTLLKAVLANASVAAFLLQLWKKLWAKLDEAHGLVKLAILTVFAAGIGLANQTWGIALPIDGAAWEVGTIVTILSVAGGALLHAIGKAVGVTGEAK